MSIESISDYSEFKVRKEAVTQRKNIHRVTKCTQGMLSKHSGISQSSISRVESLSQHVNIIMVINYVDGLISFINDNEKINDEIKSSFLDIITQLKKRLTVLTKVEEHELVNKELEDDFHNSMKLFDVLKNSMPETRRSYQLDLIINTLSRYMVNFGFSSRKFNPIFKIIESEVSKSPTHYVDEPRNIFYVIILWLKNIVAVNRVKSDFYLKLIDQIVDQLHTEVKRNEELKSKEEHFKKTLKLNRKVLYTYEITAHQINGGDASFEGNFVKAKKRLTRAIEMLEENEDYYLDFNFQVQQNPYVTCRCDLARTIYFMGEREKAFAYIDEAYKYCTDTSFDRAFVLFDEIELLYLERKYDELRDKSLELMRLTQKQSFYQYNRMGQFYYKIATSYNYLGKENTQELFTELQNLLLNLEEHDIRLGITRNYCILAELCLKAGLISDGLDFVEKGLKYTEDLREEYYLPELHRIKALIYIKLSGDQKKSHYEIAKQFDLGLNTAESKTQQAYMMQLLLLNSMLDYYEGLEGDYSSDIDRVKSKLEKVNKMVT